MGFFPLQTCQKSRLTPLLWPCAATVAVIAMTGCGGKSSAVNLPPTITSFLATPATIVPGGTADLIGIWPLLSNNNNASGVINPGNYTINSGQVVPVSPLVTTTYTLTVNNETGVTVSQSCTVTVGTVVQASLGVFAGMPSGAGMVNATATAAKFDYPASVAADGAGNTYVADTGNHCIRVISAAGVVSTLAGNPGYPGSGDGLGAQATFNHPSGVAVGANGNVYVADTYNSTIRVVTPAGQVTTLAGVPGTPGSVPVNGTLGGGANPPTFNHPSALAVDAALNVYVADTGFNELRLISASGVVSTLAGTGQAGALDAPAVSATFNAPMGVAVDASGNVYVADTGNNTVRELSNGIVSTVAGSAGSTGALDGTGAMATFASPTGLAVSATGSLYVADTGNQTIRLVKPGGVVTTLAGTAGTSGHANATGKGATFYTPRGLALDGAQNLYVADASNNLIRVISPLTVVGNCAGVAGAPGWTEGTGTAVRFNQPSGLAVTVAGTTFVADTGNHVIRQLTAAGVSSTLAGTGQVAGSLDGTGTGAGFNGPTDLAMDGTGNLYVVDAGNQTIRKVTPAGVVTTLAGVAGSAGDLDGNANTALFNGPTALALDQYGNVYVADTGNGAIRVVSTAGRVTTLATGFADLQGLAVDATDHIYAADAATNAIYVLTSVAPTAVLAGIPGTMGSTDGAAAAATFNQPTRLTLDAAGNLYIADAGNGTVRMLTPAGAVSTVVGTAGTLSIMPGNLPGSLVNPGALAVNPATGLLYLCVPDAILQAQF